MANNKNKMTQLNIRIPFEEKELLIQIAKAHHRSISNYIRWILTRIQTDNNYSVAADYQEGINALIRHNANLK